MSDVYVTSRQENVLFQWTTPSHFCRDSCLHFELSALILEPRQKQIRL